MKINKIYSGIALAFVLAFTTGCEKDFLDINNDPNNPSQVAYPLALSGAQGAMTVNLSHSTLGLSQEASAIMQQLVNFRIGAYDEITGSSYSNQWQSIFYDALASNERLLNDATASGDYAYVGIAKLQKAYMYSVLVDLFGDVPYFEALKGVNNLGPKFDDDQAIYNDLFRLIDEGMADLDKESLKSPEADDLFYQGDLAKWKKFGNSLKLRMYNQVRLVQNVTGPVNALLANPAQLMSSSEDDFEFMFGASSAIAPDNRHPGYTVDYANGQRENQINPYFYNLMKNNNDPRIPYYFYNQRTNANPLATVDYQDGRFVSVRFGSTGPYAASNNDNNYTLQGLYPIGGKYDAGTGGVAGSASGTGKVAQRFLTYFMTKFNEAELRVALGLGGDRAAFEEAVRASFEKVSDVVQQSGASAPLLIPADYNQYITDALSRYDAASNKVEVILTEKYIASFGYGIDIYNDYRRTGFPQINDPDTDNDPQTIKRGPYPIRLPYYFNELTSNPNAPKVQPNIATERVFWDPN